jgi:hypothetical protein
LLIRPDLGEATIEVNIEDGFEGFVAVAASASVRLRITAAKRFKRVESATALI